MNTKFDLKKGNVIMLNKVIDIEQEWLNESGICGLRVRGKSRLFVYLGIENNEPRFSTYRDTKSYPNFHLWNQDTGLPMTLDEIAEATTQVWKSKDDFRKNYKIKLGMYLLRGDVIQVIQENGGYLTLLRMTPYDPGKIKCVTFSKSLWIEFTEGVYKEIPQAKRLTQLIEEKTIRQTNPVLMSTVN